MAPVNNLITVSEKLAIIIGGTSGIGKSIAKTFAAEGADVVATSRNFSSVQKTAEELRELGASTITITSDVTDRDSIEELFETVRTELGHAGILINSAGTVSHEPIRSTTETQWKSVLDVQLDGVYRTSQTYVRNFETGCIINISSILAMQAAESLASYSSSKAGVNALTRALAKELAPDFRVNAIAPGYISTPINQDVYEQDSQARKELEAEIPLERMGEPQDIAGAAVYLASDAAAYTTGSVLTVDGGVTGCV